LCSSSYAGKKPRPGVGSRFDAEKLALIAPPSPG
jgi:hypothetical protein